MRGMASIPMSALSPHRDSGQGRQLSVNQDDAIQSQASPTITLVDQDLEEPAAPAPTVTVASTSTDLGWERMPSVLGLHVWREEVHELRRKRRWQPP